MSRSTQDLKPVIPTHGQINEYVARIEKVRKNSRSKEKRARLKIIIAEMKILKSQLY